jgi:hypothetical protein
MLCISSVMDMLKYKLKAKMIYNFTQGRSLEKHRFNKT